MDILLVNSPVKRMSSHAAQNPPLGLGYIASLLLANGYDVKAIDYNLTQFNCGNFEKLLENESPAILGISANTETYLNGLKIANTARQINPGIKIVMGGPHPTVMYHEAAREKDIDVVARGEGEYTMLELADHYLRGKGHLAEITGIAYQLNEDVKVTAHRSYINSPDNLPFPARELFPMHLYLDPGQVLMSRGGCPFNCRFCAVNNIWEGARRYRSPANVVEELSYIFDHFAIKDISFDDDAFTLNRPKIFELYDLSRQLAARFPWRWTCTTRVDLVDRELLAKMHEAGCYRIQFGIEAGSQKILDSMGKKITPDQAKRAVAKALDCGIRVACFFMFPQPEDTEQTIEEQIKLMKELRQMGAVLTLAMTTPYPGTYYYEHAEELGINILAKSWDEYDCKHLIFTTRNLSEDRLNFLLQKIIDDVGMRVRNNPF